MATATGLSEAQRSLASNGARLQAINLGGNGTGDEGVKALACTDAPAKLLAFLGSNGKNGRLVREDGDHAIMHRVKDFYPEVRTHVLKREVHYLADILSLYGSNTPLEIVCDMKLGRQSALRVPLKRLKRALEREAEDPDSLIHDHELDVDDGVVAWMEGLAEAALEFEMDPHIAPNARRIADACRRAV